MKKLLFIVIGLTLLCSAGAITYIKLNEPAPRIREATTYSPPEPTVESTWMKIAEKNKQFVEEMKRESEEIERQNEIKRQRLNR